MTEQGSIIDPLTIVGMSSHKKCDAILVCGAT